MEIHSTFLRARARSAMKSAILFSTIILTFLERILRYLYQCINVPMEAGMNNTP